jgi:hypothetical protein
MLYNIVLVNPRTLHKMLSQLISDLELLAADHPLSLSLFLAVAPGVRVTGHVPAYLPLKWPVDPCALTRISFPPDDE